MSDDELLDQLIIGLEVFGPRPITLESGDFTYVIVRRDDENWDVRKLVNEHLVEYSVYYSQGKWRCNCQAGTRGYQCKHATWVSTIADLQKRLGSKCAKST